LVYVSQYQTRHRTNLLWWTSSRDNKTKNRRGAERTKKGRTQKKKKTSSEGLVFYLSLHTLQWRRKKREGRRKRSDAQDDEICLYEWLSCVDVRAIIRQMPSWFSFHLLDEENHHGKREQRNIWTYNKKKPRTSAVGLPTMYEVAPSHVSHLTRRTTMTIAAGAAGQTGVAGVAGAAGAAGVVAADTRRATGT
jgi:hypothetical protein